MGKTSFGLQIGDIKVTIDTENDTMVKTILETLNNALPLLSGAAAKSGGSQQITVYIPEEINGPDVQSPESLAYELHRLNPSINFTTERSASNTFVMPTGNPPSVGRTGL